MKPPLFLFLFLFSLTSVYAGKYPVSGFVQCRVSGERLVGASVYRLMGRSGATTNSYGFFRLFVNDTASTSVVVRFLGYEPVKTKLKSSNKISFKIHLLKCKI